MEFVVHNRRNMTLRAAFIVAFFASFFTHAIDFSGLESREPQEKQFIECQTASGFSIGAAEGSTFEACKGLAEQYHRGGDYAVLQSGPLFCEEISESWDGPEYEIVYKYRPYEGSSCIRYGSSGNRFKNGVVNEVKECPHDDHPAFTIPRDTTGNGIIDRCYNPAHIQEQLDDEAQKAQDDNNCENLVLDSGNNNSASMCYTSPTGSSCNVEIVQGAGYDYYQGISSNPLGCSNSDKPPFDNKGIGDERDDCITSNNTNFCKADKTKHCTTNAGIETCDDGCLQIGDTFMCDPKKHPDVGEGDSDYFDSNGTCSVVAGSAYKGACEELGGIWDKSGDYEEARCPSSPMGHCCLLYTSPSPRD